MRQALFFFLVLVLPLFASDYQVIEDTSDLKILTPSLQERTTQKIKLANGLEILLISDPSIQESGAALAVHAGSWDDPKQYSGMAHFIEHMLFQGTKAFPSSSDFIHFISDRGGKFNAYTSFDRTVYMFSINNSSFFETLDRFSQFFASPLFNSSAIKSELFAIDQEHAKNVENDARRVFQVWKATSNPKHPNSNFATGNSETLSVIPREAILEWHQKNYLPSNMRLVVYSNLKMEELLVKVSSMFKAIHSEKSEKKVILEELTSSDQKGHFLYVKPIKEIQQLSLQWELPKNFAKDETQSAKLIAYALSYGHENSLFQILKNENLAEKLNADVFSIGKENIFLEIEIDLTDKGIKNPHLIIEKCFQALALLKKQGVPSHLFHEIETMKKINYENQSRTDAFSYVSEAANDLLDEPLSSYPKKTIFAKEYSSKNISLILEQLKPDLCLYTIVANPEKTKVLPNVKEKWAGVEYALIKMEPKTIEHLSNISLSKEMKLPPQNPFIPSSLALLNQEPSTSPIKVIDDKSGMLYHFVDNFKTPQINWIFHIKTPLLDKSPKSVCLRDLYLKSLLEKTSSLFIQAQMAGIYPSIKVVDQEIVLHIDGYSEKAPLVLIEILKNMTNLETTKEQFESYVSYLLKGYGNVKFNLPLSQAQEQFSTLVQNSPTSEEKLNALPFVTHSDFLTFSSNVFKKIYVEGMLVGNLSIKDCESLWLDIQGTFGATPYLKPLENKILSFPEGPFQISKKTEAAGTGIMLVLDQNPFSFQKRAAQNILAQALEEPFYSQLRTEQKTAYMVYSYDLELKKHLYQIFALQSSTHDSLELLYRFEIFIDQYLQNIQTNIDKARFENIKENKLVDLKKPPKNLYEAAQLLDQLAFNYKDFNYKEKRIKALSDLSYDEFIKYASEFLSRDNKKRVAVFMNGKIPLNLKYFDVTVKDLCDKGSYTCYEIDSENKEKPEK
jgi:insulysin